MNYFTKDKPYNSLNEYYKSIYNTKIAKISLNGGFSCPNKDGKKGYHGCIYCSPKGSGDFAGDVNKSITEQFNEQKLIMDRKWKNSKYIVYFQAGSNTYASIETLERLYSEALAASNDIVGIDIATRSDCIDEDIAKLLGKLNTSTHVTVELGLQSSNSNTQALINRCENNIEFENAISLLRKYNIEIVVHIINGLPNENIKDMLETINYINRLDIQGIKFHSLLILKPTKLFDLYLKNPFHILTLEEYVDIVVKQISILRDDIIIHRLAADGVVNDLFEPKWTMKKLVVMNEIDKKMRHDNLYQGIYYKKPTS